MATLTKKVRQELRTRVFKLYNIVAEFTPLDADDPRRERPCSNNRSHKCPGHKATHVRANKVYCDTCYQRCNKERSRIEVRAKAHLDSLVAEVEAGNLTTDEALTKVS